MKTVKELGNREAVKSLSLELFEKELDMVWRSLN